MAAEVKSQFGNRLTRFLRGGVNPTPFEMRMLRLGLEYMPDRMAAVIRTQLEQYNLVQREIDGRELNFYKVRGLRTVCDVKPLLEIEGGEVPLVKLAVRVPGEEMIHAVLHAVNRRFFCITFGAPVDSLAMTDEVEVVKITRSWRSAV